MYKKQELDALLQESQTTGQPDNWPKTVYSKRGRLPLSADSTALQGSILKATFIPDNVVPDSRNRFAD